MVLNYPQTRKPERLSKTSTGKFIELPSDIIKRKKTSIERFFLYRETKIQKLHKGKACKTFPVLERKGKAANYRFAVGVNPVDSQVRKSLQDSGRQELQSNSRGCAILRGLQEGSGIVLSKKGKHPKARKSENAKSRSFLERKGDQPVAGG